MELDALGYQGKICIAREISKLFEQHLTCDFEELKAMLGKHQLQIKGEFVVGLMPK
jgi:hypothetical protein